MGKHFGNLQRLYGINYYCLSPYELKPLKGMLFPGLRNTVRRFRENLFYIGVPLILTVAVINAGLECNRKMHRKNPLDYACEV